METKVEYDNQNRGVLFQNDKGDNPKRPDYKGEVNIGGADFKLSGWKRMGKDGKPFLSLSVEAKGANKPTEGEF